MSEDEFQLSDGEDRTLAALLDELIPPRADAGIPGAGALGLAAEVAAGTTALGSQDELRDALSRLHAAAVEEGAEDFAALDREARLRVIGRMNEADAEFPQSLLYPTYVVYYQNERVARSLGLETWPPHPQGFPLEPGDLSLLDPVRARGPLFREV